MLYSEQIVISVIFNWIQFRNDECIANYQHGEHVTEAHGVCYTSQECSNRGGIHRSNCAAGYGSCCVCEYLCGLQATYYSFIVKNLVPLITY